MLIDKKFPFKTRTTVHSELLKEDDINSIILDLSERKYTGTYYLQNYLHVKETVEELPEFSSAINKILLNNIIPITFRN